MALTQGGTVISTSAKAYVAALVAALSFLAGVVSTDSSWVDLGRPAVVVGALAAAAVAFGATWGVRNGVSPSPYTSTPER